MKSFIAELQTQLDRNRTELIEIEEKNINLAEFIRKDIMNKSTIIDPSPTFKDTSMSKSFNASKESEVPLKDYGSVNGKGLDYADYLQKSRKYNKKYGKEAQENPQVALILLFFCHITAIIEASPGGGQRQTLPDPDKKVPPWEKDAEHWNPIR